jgi:hypothetical protein
MSEPMQAPAEPEVLIERRGSAGLITLNRPKALNALTLGMVREMRRALDAFAVDPAVTRIVVTGAGGRAFCAGGDIRTLHDLGKAGRHDEMLAFWREEYILNARIKSYPKPYVALIDGIVMGGGVGISLQRQPPHRRRPLFSSPCRRSASASSPMSAATYFAAAHGRRDRHLSRPDRRPHAAGPMRWRSGWSPPTRWPSARMAEAHWTP